MGLENRALSAPRNGAAKSRRKPQEDTRRVFRDISSTANNNVGQKRRSRPSSTVAKLPDKRRRTNAMEQNTIVLYNLPPQFDSKKLNDDIERWILEMRNVEVEVVSCRATTPIDGTVTAFVEFRNSSEARLAMSLNGIKYQGKNALRTLYARMYDQEKKDKEKTGMIKEREALCIANFIGSCKRGASCIHAHGLTGLRLYSDTVLDESRCVYLNNLPKTLHHMDLARAIIDRYKESNIDVFMTFFRHRRPNRDAFFEVANPSHAKVAPEILDGLWSLRVHCWKPEYQAAFVYEDSSEDQRTKNKIIVPDKCTSSSDKGRGSTSEEVSKQNSKPDTNRSIKPDMIECFNQTDADLKETIIQLREEVLRAKTDAVTSKEKANDIIWKYKELTQDHKSSLQKLEALEADCDDLKKRLCETKDDVRYYRDKVDRLERENDSLHRQNSDSNREQEQSRMHVQELERQLSGAIDHKNTYLKDLEEAREKVLELENTNHQLHRQVSKSASSYSSMATNSSLAAYSSLELKFREAMSRNERLAKSLKEATEKAERRDDTNDQLRKEKEAIAMELEQLRATKKNDQAMAGNTLTRRVSKVKLEPTE